MSRKERFPAASCYVCAGIARGGLEKDGYRYSRCVVCGHAALLPVPSEAELSALYDRSYFQEGKQGGYGDYVGDEALHRRNAVARLKRLQRAGVAPPGTLLEVGCAVGFFLEAAEEAGFVAHGLDVSPWAAAEARRRGYRVMEDRQALGRDEYDAAALFQVLEHTADPCAVLGKVHESLRDHGWLILETWNRESLVARGLGGHWQQVTPPSVVHLFSRRSVTQLLTRAGYRSIRVQRSAKLVSAGSVGSLLRQKYPRAARPVHWLTQRPWLERRALPYGLGDLITVTARKTS